MTRYEENLPPSTSTTFVPTGKPIFSLHEDDSRMAGLAALITALVSVVGDLGDQLRHIQAGTTLVVMLTRGPLILVACSRTKEPLQALRKQLELLYLQVLLVVTTGEFSISSLLSGVQRPPSRKASDSAINGQSSNRSSPMSCCL